MVKILINVWYPNEKSNEVVKKFIEVEKVYPINTPLIKPLTTWELWATKTGIKGTGIFKVIKGKFKETINFFVRRLSIYAQDIEGYTFEISASLTSKEGKTLIGKDLSEFLIPEDKNGA
jgi:hypothetical protein